MMFGLDLTTWLRFLIWLGVGLAIYFGYGRFHSKAAMESAEQVRASAS